MDFTQWAANLKDGRKVAHALSWIILAGVLLAMASGALAQSGDVYGERGAQVASTVRTAIVLQSRPVRVQADDQTRYAGTAAGGALVGGLGARLGRSSNTATVVLGLAGASLGSLAGAKLATTLGGSDATEFIVQEVTVDGRSGQITAITQPAPSEPINAGDMVYLVNTIGTWRVVRARQVHVPNGAHREAEAGPRTDERRSLAGFVMTGS